MHTKQIPRADKRRHLLSLRRSDTQDKFRSPTAESRLESTGWDSGFYDR